MPNETIVSYASLLESQLDEAIRLIKAGEAVRAVSILEEAKNGNLGAIISNAQND